MSGSSTKVCFVVGPIGDPDSDARVHADWILEEIIEPVLSQFPHFAVVRADQIAPPGMIDAQVIQHLLDSDLVIADLSRENPNAFYEIGIRHMAQKPIIHMQLVDEKVPFDVSLYRTLKFSRARPSDLKNARAELKRAVEAVLADGYKVDNPVTRARGKIRLEESATPEQKVILDQLTAIQARLERLESGNLNIINYRMARSEARRTLPVRISIRGSNKTSVDKVRHDIMKFLQGIDAGFSMARIGDDFVFSTNDQFLKHHDWERLREEIDNTAKGAFVSVDIES